MPVPRPAGMVFQTSHQKRANKIFKIQFCILLGSIVCIGHLAAAIWSHDYDWARFSSGNPGRHSVIFCFVVAIITFLYTLLTMFRQFSPLAFSSPRDNLAPILLLAVLLLFGSIIPAALTGWPAGAREHDAFGRLYAALIAIANIIQLCSAGGYFYIAGSLFWGLVRQADANKPDVAKVGRIRLGDEEARAGLSVRADQQTEGAVREAQKEAEERKRFEKKAKGKKVRVPESDSEDDRLRKSLLESTGLVRVVSK